MNKKPLLFVAVGFLITVGLIFAVLNFTASKKDDTEFVVPEKIASLPKTQVVSGIEAIKQISRLHGKPIVITQGYIAQYAAEGREITLWVSVSPSNQEGEELFRVMDEKMPNSKVFTNREVVKVKNKDVIKVLGMGQKHYYWVNGKYNYWVAINGMDAAPVLEEVMKLE